MDELKFPIYLDYNATTPVHPAVADVMRPYLGGHFGNPSSVHVLGIETRAAVENARNQVAGLLGCTANEIVFTSGGTESDNYAIKGYARANKKSGNHIITSCIEHPAVLNVYRYLEENGFNVTYLPVDQFGMVKADDFEQSVCDKTIFVSIMHVNNEVGTIQPVDEISAIAHQHEIAVHVDAAQSIGKIPCNVDALDADMLTVAGHKLYAPKGVGALYIRNNISLEPLLHGAGHEHGHRASTENVMGIVGLGKACELINRADKNKTAVMARLRDQLQQDLESGLSDTRINGHPEKRLPNTLSISFKGIRANELVQELSETVAISAGAACHGNDVKISHVLKAMQVPEEWAMGTVRFSVGQMTTEEEIKKAAELVTEAVRRLRKK